MKFALSSHVLMAHWVPGFLVVMALRPMLLNSSSLILKSVVGSDNSGGTLEILSVVVAAFLIGELLDATRDLLENLWDCFQPLKWEFLVTGDKEKVENFKAAYFTYYAFDCNASLGLGIVLLLAFVTSAPLWTLGVLALFLIIFAVNAILLRSEMARLTRQ